MRFLLLDDEKVSRFTLRQMVQTIAGATIHEAADAEQARAELAKLPAPAVCIFDVRLPGESGLDLLAWLRAQLRFQSWPVLLYTGNEDDDTRHKAVSLRVDGFLSKPPDASGAERVSAVAARLADDLLPDPRALAQRLGTSTGHLANYIDALEKQVIELGNTSDNAAWNAVYARCLQVGKALNSRYLVQILQQLQVSTPDDRRELLIAANVAIEGMRERFAMIA